MLLASTFFDEATINGFEDHLLSVNVERLPIAPYCKSYLRYIIGHKKYYCRVYAHILSLALQYSGKAKETICFLDYGAGNGLLGLFAKYSGVGKVYINDITPDFLMAAKELALALHIAPDGFIEGDMKDTVAYFSFAKPPDIIAGTDVIEHIYSLEVFFKTIRELNPEAITVFSTASNPFNWLKVQQLKKVQIKDELYGGSPGRDVLFGEIPEASFLSARKKIIQVYAAGRLDEATIDSLAKMTRGSVKADIEKAVEKYINEKIFPLPLNDSTNTCDPVSGSWSERLLTLKEYENIYCEAGFEVTCYSGFYNQYETSFKSRLLFFLNKLIPFTGHRLAPFISLAGKPLKK